MPPRFCTGVVAPLFTPARPDGAVDPDSAAGLVDHLAGTGAVRSVFCRSGLGKMYTFTVDDTKRLARAVVGRAKRRGLGALVGCAGEWLRRDEGVLPDPERYTEQSVTLARHARSLGADAAVLVLPAALIRPGTDAHEVLFDHVKTVHDAAGDLPIVLYQAPGLPEAIRLTPAALTRLRSLPRVVGAKVSSADDAVMKPLLDSVRGSDFAFLCGDERYYLSGLRQGAVGVIGEGACIAPSLLAAVERRFRAGDAAGAERAQQMVAEAIAAKGDMDPSLAGIQRMARRGAKTALRDRSLKPPYPDSRIAAFDEALLALEREAAAP